jgi:hypothetical protein
MCIMAMSGIYIHKVGLIIIFLNSIDQLSFVMKTCFVFFKVGTERLNII